MLHPPLIEELESRKQVLLGKLHHLVREQNIILCQRVVLSKVCLAAPPPIPPQLSHLLPQCSYLLIQVYQLVLQAFDVALLDSL